jgi:hypothetical protein
MTPTTARRLLAATLTILAARAWTPGSIGARTGRDLPTPGHPHNAGATVIAFVDPDAAFIH